MYTNKIVVYPILSYPISGFPILSYPIATHPFSIHAPSLSYPILSLFYPCPCPYPIISLSIPIPFPLHSYPISIPILSSPILVAALSLSLFVGVEQDALAKLLGPKGRMISAAINMRIRDWSVIGFANEINRDWPLGWLFGWLVDCTVSGCLHVVYCCSMLFNVVNVDSYCLMVFNAVHMRYLFLFVSCHASRRRLNCQWQFSRQFTCYSIRQFTVP